MPSLFRFRLAELDQRTRHLLATAGTGYLARFASVVTVLLTIPIARHTLDAELFGVWMMFGGLIAFFAFADLGIGNALMNRITHAVVTNDQAGLARLVVAAYFCASLIAMAVLLLWGLWLCTASEPTSVAGAISSSNRLEVLHALDVFVLVVALNVPASLILKIQLGAQQGAWANLTQLAASLLTCALVPAAFLLHAELAWAVLASTGVQVVVNLLGAVVWLRRSGWLGHSQECHPDWSTVAQLWRSGMVFLSIQLAAAFAFQSDAIVITQRLGQTIYGEFAAVQKLFMTASMLVGTAAVAMWPAFGDAIARGQLAWARQALARALGWTAALIGTVCMLLALTGGWIMRRWVGMEVPPSSALTMLLAAWTFVDALGSINAAFMNAAGMLRAQMVVALLMALSAFTGKWLLTPILGTPGAVLATLASYCALSVPTQIYLHRRFFSKAN